MRIRLARPEDRETLGALKLGAALEWGDQVDQLRSLPEARSVPAEHIPLALVAEISGQIVGFATVLCGDGDEAELEDLFVEPHLWGRGVGTVLAAEAERRARSFGVRALKVVANSRAQIFYERQGFEVVGTVQTDLETALEMRKNLR